MIKRTSLASLPLVALVAAACACSPAQPPPSSGSATASPPLNPGTPVATTDGADAGADAAPPLPTDPPLCTRDAWAPGSRIRNLPSLDLQSLAGLTPLGRTLVWVDTSGTIKVADRSDSTSDFGDSVEVGEVSPMGRAALHPAGALLFATNTSRTGLVVYQRLYRKDPWAGPSTRGLDALNPQLLSLGATIAEMTIGGTPGSLFMLLEVGGTSALYEASFDAAAGAWGRATLHDEPSVASTPTSTRRPTGLSWDGRTLFFFDSSAGTTRAAWRASPTAVFDSVTDVGAFPMALPSQSCSLLYYVGHDNDGSGLFTATR